MDRDRQHVGAVVENALRAVAVVDVPIDHRDLADAVLRLGRIDGDGDVGEEAEAHRLVGKAVVPGGAAQRIGVARPAGDDGVDRFDGKACGQCREFEAALAEGGEQAKLAAARIAHALEFVDIAGGVDAQQILARGGRCAAHFKVLVQPRGPHQIEQAALGSGRIGAVAARRRLDPVADGKEQRLHPGAVPEGTLIGQEQGAATHCVSLPRCHGPRTAQLRSIPVVTVKAGARHWPRRPMS